MYGGGLFPIMQAEFLSEKKRACCHIAASLKTQRGEKLMELTKEILDQTIEPVCK